MLWLVDEALCSASFPLSQNLLRARFTKENFFCLFCFCFCFEHWGEILIPTASRSATTTGCQRQVLLQKSAAADNWLSGFDGFGRQKVGWIWALVWGARHATSFTVPSGLTSVKARSLGCLNACAAPLEPVLNLTITVRCDIPLRRHQSATFGASGRNPWGGKTCRKFASREAELCVRVR